MCAVTKWSQRFYRREGPNLLVENCSSQGDVPCRTKSARAGFVAFCRRPICLISTLTFWSELEEILWHRPGGSKITVTSMSFPSFSHNIPWQSVRLAAGKELCAFSCCHCTNHLHQQSWDSFWLLAHKKAYSRSKLNLRAIVSARSMPRTNL